MKLFLLLLAVGTVAVVECTRVIHQTPGIAPLETVIQAGQRIASLEDLAMLLNLPSSISLKIERSRIASNGLYRHKIRMYYDNVPIQVFIIQATSNANGEFTGAVSGYGTPAFDLDVSKNVGRRKLRQKTAEFFNSENEEEARQLFGNVTESDLQRCSYKKLVFINVTSGDAFLSYFVKCLVDLGARGFVRTPRVIIRVSDLQVLEGSISLRLNGGIERRWSSLERPECPRAQGGNEKFVGLTYGPGFSETCLRAEVKGKKCRLQNDKIIVKTAFHQFDRSLSEVVTFDCEDGLNDVVNGAFSPAADTFHYSQEFLAMMSDWAGVDSISDSPIILTINYGDRYFNAFWDGWGSCFGDGTDILFPFTTRDIIGHELCHAFTDSMNNLVFDDESLAINEAFSDMCGQALGVFARPFVHNWAFGEAVKKLEGAAFRYFDDPTRDGHRISHIGDFVPGPMTSWKGQGIFMKVFYQLVEEENIQFRVVFELMVYSNLIYWQEDTSFTDGACGVLRAASDLGVDTHKVESAFEVVGINLDFCSLRGTRDVITGDAIRENVIVSCDKNPKFDIVIPGCNQGVRVTIEGGQVPVYATLYDESYTELAYGTGVVTYHGAGTVTLVLKSSDTCEQRISLWVEFI